jgi:hypothetical protein
VYGDWLLEQGEPLGELVSVQAALAKQKRKNPELLAREKALLAAQERTLGRFRAFDHTWSFGFLESIVLGGVTTELYASLVGLVAARFLRELDVHLDGGDGERVPEILLAHGLPPALRKLALVSAAPRATRLGSLQPLWPELARIKELTVQAGAVDLGAIALPAATTVAIATLGTGGAVAALAAAEWDAVESLSLDLFDPAAPGGAPLTIPVLRPLLDRLPRLPALRHLGLSQHDAGDGVVEALLRSNVLPRLTSLDLSASGISDVGARAILERADAFAHLDSLDLRENDLSAGAANALERTLGLAVDVGEQGERGADDEDDDDDDDDDEDD